MSVAPQTLLVGVGSMLGDDQAGWIVAERVAERLQQSPDATGEQTGILVRLATVPLDVLDWVHGVHNLHLVDACRSECPSGTIHRLDWPDQTGQLTGAAEGALLQLGGHTTHDYGLADVLLLAETTGRLPPNVTIWAIDGENFQLEHGLNDAVEDVLNEVVDRIIREISHICGDTRVARNTSHPDH